MAGPVTVLMFLNTSIPSTTYVYFSTSRCNSPPNVYEVKSVVELLYERLAQSFSLSDVPSSPDPFRLDLVLASPG